MKRTAEGEGFTMTGEESEKDGDNTGCGWLILFVVAYILWVALYTYLLIKGWLFWLPGAGHIGAFIILPMLLVVGLYKLKDTITRH